MFVRFDLELKAEGKLSDGWLHRWLYKILDQGVMAPEASRIHEAGDVPLFSTGLRRERNGSTYKGYISTSDIGVIGIIASQLVDMQKMMVGDEWAHVTKMWMADKSDFDTLLKRGKESNGLLSVKFISPVIFKRNGKNDCFPGYRQIWGTWYRNWVRRGGLAPVDEDGFLAWVDEIVRMRRFELRSELMMVKGTGLAGCVGTMEMALEEGELASFARALGAFAGFFGTGNKTAMGFGWTVVRG